MVVDGGESDLEFLKVNVPSILWKKMRKHKLIFIIEIESLSACQNLVKEILPFFIA